MTSRSIAAAVLLALTIGCGSGSMFETTPSIRGEIRAMIPGSGGDDLGFARIVGKRDADTQYDRADVTVNRATSIFRRRGGLHEALTFDSLIAGMMVEVTFTGPVMESYPVRATAATIAVID